VPRSHAYLDKSLAFALRNREAPDRLLNKARVLLDRRSDKGTLLGTSRPDPRDEVMTAVFDNAYASPDPLNWIEASLALMRQDLARVSAPFQTYHNASSTVGRVCFDLCRQLRPLTVIETGVAYGVTSRYVLEALRQNGTGKLHSVDLPPLARDADSYVGYFVQPELRSNWDLRPGSARKLLPPLLREHPPDVFIHDSLHTFAHMQWEFGLALAALRPGGVLIADDIEGNRAFEEALKHPRAGAWFVTQQEGKKAICGAIRIKA
jgi:hypothetical protein